MKKSLLVVLALFSASVFASGTPTKICHDKVVKGKKATVCKTVKVHKQVEGDTKVPTKKK
jgi:hypothetical protein